MNLNGSIGSIKNLSKVVKKMLAENKDKKISIRLSESDYTYLQVLAYIAGMNVSKYIRTLCDASINAIKISEKQGKVNIEDIKALLND